MAGRKSDFTLTKLDDLFSTQEQRDEEKLSKIRDIPLTEIDDFPDHPFKVRDDEDMAQLIESIKERGVITPATVRQKEDGRYELISGHRRKRACELAGFDTLRCEVVDLNRDEATILMVESNYQRSKILPSEKAFAYKMRLDAMKRQGERNDLTCDPLGDKLAGTKSVMLLADKSDDSKTQIQRYIRLTNLVPELLEYVDEGRIKMRPAVELSFLDEDSQRDVVDEIDLNRDEATILMVESNYQRSQILPSEKAYAYKMRLEAMKRQAGRPSKDNLVPVGQNFSREELATQSGESQTQIQRYIRLTNLVPELLDYVDEGRIKMRPAVELSFLDEDSQRDVVDEIDLNDATPSHDQTIRMRKFFEEGKLTTEAIQAIMSEEKPNQREKIVLRGDRVRQLIPKNIPISQTEDFVCKALEHYNKFLRSRADRDSR